MFIHYLLYNVPEKSIEDSSWCGLYLVGRRWLASPCIDLLVQTVPRLSFSSQSINAGLTYSHHISRALDFATPNHPSGSSEVHRFIRSCCRQMNVRRYRKSEIWSLLLSGWTGSPIISEGKTYDCIFSVFY